MCRITLWEGVIVKKIYKIIICVIILIISLVVEIYDINNGTNYVNYIFYIIDFIISCTILISVFKFKLTKQERILRITLFVILTVYFIIGVFFNNIFIKFNGVELFIELLIYSIFFVNILFIKNND